MSGRKSGERVVSSDSTDVSWMKKFTKASNRVHDVDGGFPENRQQWRAFWNLAYVTPPSICGSECAQ